MINLIPAWPLTAQRLQEDATVNLTHLLKDGDVSVRLVITDYAPSLRYFLAYNDLLGTPWFSVFDEIQQVSYQQGLPLNVADIHWPDDVEAIDTLQSVHLYRHEQLVGNVVVSAAGYVQAVEWQTDQGQQIDDYDDRGFLSATIWRDTDGKLEKKTWWTAMGNTALVQDSSGFHWYTAPVNAPQTFENREALITAVLGIHIQANERFAAHLVPKNATLIQQIAKIWPTTVQLAGASDVPETEINGVIDLASHVVLPTEQLQTRLQQRLSDVAKAKLQVIAPYATGLELGYSNEEADLQIYWYINDLTADRMHTLFGKLLEMMIEHEDYALRVAVHYEEEAERLSQQALMVITRSMGISTDSPEYAQIQVALTQKETPQMQNVDESVLDEHEKKRLKSLTQVKSFLKRLDYRVASDFETIRRDFQQARLLLDLGHAPDLFMQIRAISAGIPQINETATGYVQQRENGMIVHGDDEVLAAVQAYLDQLDRWSQALVVNTRLIDVHARPELLARWEEVL